MAAPSPELRRALLLGVARQLGWMPASPAPAQPPSTLPSPSSAPSTPPVDSSPPPPQNDLGVQFVDLPPVEAPSPESSTASVEPPPSTAPPAPSTTATTTASNTSEDSSSRSAASIPAFVSGTNLVFAIDSSVLPIGTEAVSFYSGSEGGSVAFRGTIALGYNPTVVTMPIFQVRAFDNQAGTWATSLVSGSGPNRILANVSGGALSVVTFRFTLPEASSSSSP
jgi:hypothetical protein